MKSNSISRRGLLIGAAATVAVRRAQAADETSHPITEAISRDAAPTPPFAYIGCYTGGTNARGISVFHYDPQTSQLSLVSIVAPVSSPSFIALDANKKFLYSGNESGSGSASSFRVNSQTGALQFMNSVAAGGQPAHIAIHPSGNYLLTANYTGGTVAVFPIQSEGSLAGSPQIISHFGSLGPNSSRQEAPHPHMMLPDSTGKYVLVNDLGLDATIVYAFDTNTGTMSEVNRISATPGSGPRHLAWHPNGKVVYSINELGNVFNVYSWDGNGNLAPIQQDLSTLPQGFLGTSGAGEVMVDSAGKFLYGSNRGNDNIVICSIDPSNYQLSVVGWVPTQGETPRHFNFDPTGNFLHVANQNSANIVTFKVDKNTGMLTPAGLYASTVSPSCIQFA